MKKLNLSGLPLYLQVSESLENRIENGEFRPGDKLPGDLALSAEYGISVITARAAMRVLIDKLMVARYPGRGTFVRSKEQEQLRPVWGLGSMFDLVLTGLQTKLVLLDRRVCVPPSWAAEKFRRAPSEKLYLVKTARESKGQRFAVSEVYYRPEIGRLLKGVDFTDPELHSKLMITVLQERTGIKPKATYQTITAETAAGSDPKLLGIPPGSPLLVLSRDYYDAQDTLVQAGRSRYRVDQFEYRISIDNPSDSLPDS